MVFLTRKHLSRRTLLKGAGVSVALPLLDAMIPAGTALAQTAAARKLRVGFFYLPHGAVTYNTKYGARMDRWTPSGEGKEFTLNTINRPLEPYKKYVTSFGNIKNDLASGSIHTASPGMWLNGLKRGDSAADPGLGATVDQLIAARIGKDTPFPSLELASETTIQQASGMGTPHGSTLSFRDASTPLPMESNPRTVFLRLFTDEQGGAITKRNATQDASLLDLIREQTLALQRELDPNDRAILDSHLTAIGEAEQRVALRLSRVRDYAGALPPVPRGPLDDFSAQVRLMFDLISIAYRADLTRVVSFMMAAEGTNRTYSHIGVHESFHPLSHHVDDLARIEQLVKIQTWHMQVFAEFLQKLAAIPDGEGTLLDNAMFLYGSNMSNSSTHNSHPLPTLLIGGGAGKLPTVGRHIELVEPTPLCNLHLTLLGLAGVERKTFGDSTGTLSL
jgi:hypothetical protein